MYGETGLGKTHLSLAIAGTVIKNGGGVIYASAQNILNKLEDEKFGRSENENTQNSLIECDLLISLKKSLYLKLNTENYNEKTYNCRKLEDEQNGCGSRSAYKRP